MSYINVKLRSSTKTQTTPRPFLECRLARHVTQWQACRAARLGDICFHRLAALSDEDISIFLDFPAIYVFKRSAGSNSRASLVRASAPSHCRTVQTCQAYMILFDSTL